MCRSHQSLRPVFSCSPETIFVLTQGLTQYCTIRINAQPNNMNPLPQVADISTPGTNPIPMILSPSGGLCHSRGSIVVGQRQHLDVRMRRLPTSSAGASVPSEAVECVRVVIRFHNHIVSGITGRNLSLARITMCLKPRGIDKCTTKAEC